MACSRRRMAEGSSTWGASWPVSLSRAVLRLSSTVAAPPRARPPAPPPPAQRHDGAPPDRRFSLERLSPVVIAAVIAAVWLVLQPHTVDMAAHTFRANLFGQEGFTTWNGQWYGGHHTP